MTGRRAGDRLVLAPQQRRRTVLAAIRGARRRLVLSIFRCDDAAVPRALAAAARRGVQVQVLMTARARAAGRELDALQAWLTARGVDVRRYAGLKYHAKFLVADDRAALVTTMNLTGRCFTRTCDFTLVTRDPAVVSGLAELFAADWARRAATLTAAQRARLIVAPDHQPRQPLAALLRAARSNIRILHGRPKDAQLSALLDECRLAGVAVDIARRRDLRPLRRHGRLVIVDGSAAVIGSLALSSRALDRRRELAIVTRDPRVVARLDAFWQTHIAGRPDPVTTLEAVEVRA